MVFLVMWIGHQLSSIKATVNWDMLGSVQYLFHKGMLVRRMMTDNHPRVPKDVHRPPQHLPQQPPVAQVHVHECHVARNEAHLPLASI